MNGQKRVLKSEKARKAKTMKGNWVMKKRNLLTKLTLLFAVLLIPGAAQGQTDILPSVTLSVAQARVPRKFDRIGSLGHDSVLTRTDGAAQQNQAPSPSTLHVPPPLQYMVIELGGRRANDISQSGRNRRQQGGFPIRALPCRILAQQPEHAD